jgi:hypothetical protein
MDASKNNEAIQVKSYLAAPKRTMQSRLDIMEKFCEIISKINWKTEEDARSLDTSKQTLNT